MERLSKLSLSLLTEGDIIQGNQNEVKSSSEVGSKSQTADTGGNVFEEIISNLKKKGWYAGEACMFLVEFSKQLQQLNTKFKNVNSMLLRLNEADNEVSKDTAAPVSAEFLLAYAACIFNAVKSVFKNANEIKDAQAAFEDLNAVLKDLSSSDSSFSTRIAEDLGNLLKIRRTTLLGVQQSTAIATTPNAAPALSYQATPALVQQATTAVMSIEQAPLMAAILTGNLQEASEAIATVVQNDNSSNDSTQAQVEAKAMNDSFSPEAINHYLIWPANPYFRFSKTLKNIAYAESLLKNGTVKPSNVFVFVPRKGADGDFGYSCITQYLNSKLGLASSMGVNSHKLITQVGTFVQNCKPQNIQKESVKLDSSRERMRAKLFEAEEGTASTEGRSEKVAATDAAAKTSKTTASAGTNASTNAITVYCTPRIKKLFESQAQLFTAAGLQLVAISDGFEDDDEALKAGKQVFSDMLTFKKGTKSFSASNTDRKQAMSSMQKQQASYIDRRDRLHESAADIKLWDWENIKANTAAKQYVSLVQTDVDMIQKGMDDGGNPNKLVGVAKAIFTDLMKDWSAALGDASDLFFEGIGMPWIARAIKTGAQQYRKAPEEYEGIEAFIRSDLSTSLKAAAGKPDDYIERSDAKRGF